MLLGVRNEGGKFGPEAFSGDYKMVAGTIGVEAFLRADVFYQYSVGEHWSVHEIGIIGSLDAVPNIVNAFGSFGFGSAKLLNKEIPTSSRSWGDIISNQFRFNPLSPFN